MDQEEVYRIKDRLDAQLETFCKRYNLSAEERQELEERLEMDELVLQEKARQFTQYLESDNPGERLMPGLLIIDWIREEILGCMGPVIEGLHERIEILEERLTNRRPEISALIREEIDRHLAHK